MKKEFLMEIGTEEIPSVYISNIIADMKNKSALMFKENGISASGISVFATPRRLVLFAREVSETQDVKNEKVFGPPKDRAFDASNNPTKAAVGFAKRQGVSVEDLLFEETDKGEYIYAMSKSGGSEVRTLLEDLLPKFIFNISYPKSMRWGDNPIRFVRPIHWISAIFAGKRLDFDIEDIKCSDISYGHRFLSSKSFSFNSPKDYFKKLSESFVVLDQEERKKSINEQVTKLATEVGGTYVYDEELLTQVSFLVESPYAIKGSFDKKYLELPKELLVTVMKVHQRYFSVCDNDGKLLPYFITVSNIDPGKSDIISKGNERVISARLYDAYFFLVEDKKVKFEDYTNKLKSVLFQKKLGSVFEKTERIKTLSVNLCEKIDGKMINIVERVAKLSKSDLITNMVYEFPTLQGIMGKEYALASGESEDVSNAIFEHYLPRFADDKLPKGLAGAIIGICDRIDSITGFFGIGLIPTGSQDPLALRRQALGVINIILDNEFDIELKDIILESTLLYEGKRTKESKTVLSEVTDFLRQRFKVKMEGEGFRFDEVDSVSAGSFTNIVNTHKRLKSLSKFRKSLEFKTLTVFAKRIINITSKKSLLPLVNPDIFVSEFETNLYAEFKKVKEVVKGLNNEGDYFASLSEIAKLGSFIDSFFENVMVMDKDENVKNNRLSLLSEISTTVGEIADFSKIVSDEK